MMKKNIAILFPSTRRLGAFQYALSIAECLINYCPQFDYSILYYKPENPKQYLKAKNLNKVRFISLDGRANNFFGKLKLLFNTLAGSPLLTVNGYNKKILESSKLDIVIVPFPLLFGSEHRIPYIVSILDIMHRYYPGFPEYHLLDRLKRDIVYKHSAQKSLLSIADSQQGLEDLQKFYNIPEEKIRIIPFLPPGYVYEYKNMDEEEANSTLKKYNLPEKFLFYPAQFWYHKNHLRLIRALKLVEENEGIKIPLVLVGSPEANRANYEKALKLIEELKLGEQITHLGYVSDKEIVALYKKSWALVFPSLIGPTNIPPLEAMVLGTAVLCSNLFSMPKQIGGAGLLFDPFDIKDIAEKIYQIWTDHKLRDNLIQKGSERTVNMTLENYAKQWNKALEEAINRFKI